MRWFQTRQLHKKYQDMIDGYEDMIHRRDVLIDLQRRTMAEMREELETYKEAVGKDMRAQILELAMGLSTVAPPKKTSIQ